MKIASIALSATAVATLAFAGLPAVNTAEAASSGKSPFCFAGSPTPKYICDAIKANTKPKPAVKVRHDTVKNAIANVR